MCPLSTPWQCGGVGMRRGCGWCGRVNGGAMGVSCRCGGGEGARCGQVGRWAGAMGWTVGVWYIQFDLPHPLSPTEIDDVLEQYNLSQKIII